MKLALRANLQGDQKYERVAPFETMLNKVNRRSPLSKRYKSIRLMIVTGVGKLYLAENEKTVILPPHTEAWVKRNNTKVSVILDLVNDYLKRKE